MALKRKISETGIYMKRKEKCVSYDKKSKRMIYNILNHRITKVKDFKQHVIKHWSGLNDKDDYDKIVKLSHFFDFLCFENSKKTLENEFAIIAGSFPSRYAGTLKNAQDVDIFVLVNMHGWKNMLFWEALTKLAGRENKRYVDKITKIVTVFDIGKIQFIIKDYNFCRCDYHINKYFFNDFHAVTRFRFQVFDINDDENSGEVFLPIFIPFDDQQGILVKSNYIEKEGLSYPNKHFFNRKDNYPVSLYFQALNVVLRNNISFSI